MINGGNTNRFISVHFIELHCSARGVSEVAEIIRNSKISLDFLINFTISNKMDQVEYYFISN